MKIVDNDELLGVLQGFNPWWRGSALSAPEFRRLAFYACRKYASDPNLRRAILISGPRRVGKTTVLMQTVEELIRGGAAPKSILYLSLDHPILKLAGLSEVLRAYHEFMQPEDAPAHLLLDEIQYAPDWETEIKLLIDHKPQYKIVATGSASVLHRQKLAESGVGRWVTVHMPTLSFYEFMQIRGEDAPGVQTDLRPSDLSTLTVGDRVALASRFTRVLPSFQRYLLVGGFPETAKQEDISLSQRLLREDIVERVLKRDMTALFGVRNVNDLERLFIYLCRNTGGIIAHQPCAAALGSSTATVANHLAMLEQANLIYRLPPASTTGKRILKARNKYYLVDAALRNAVLLKGEDIFSNSTEMGCIVETTVLRHVFAYHYRDNPTISYWRNSSTQHEVDIIVESPAYLIPFEVKYKEAASLGLDSGLAEYSRAMSIPRAFLVTKNAEDFGPLSLTGLTTEFMRVPAHILIYLLGQAERLLWV
ncbi:MAG: ATP-binding protein [Humidesulfovibrio sp.]